MTENIPAVIVRTAIYVRISQDKAGAGLGVERQEGDCRRLADQLDWTVSRVYSDNDISAYSGKRRPDYEAMLADIEAGKVDAVIAWHPDRLHRSPKELERYIDVCGRIPTHTVQAGAWDLSTPAGRMVARQIGAVSRYESEHKSERVKAARIQSAQRGEWHGGLRPYGYEADGITVRPNEADEVAKMADAIASGQSLNAVVRDLNRRGVPTATGGESRWQGKTIREMLCRPRVAGFSEHHGEVVGKAVWPAIVEEDVWRAVLSILRARARGKSERGRGAVWLGSGQYVCGVCGSHKTKVGSSSGSRKTYRCANREGDIRNHVSREAVGLDNFVENLLVEYLSQPGTMEKLLTRDDSVDARALRVESATIGTRKDELATAFANGLIDVAQLGTATKVLDDRAQAIAKELASVGVRSPLEPLAGGKVGALWLDLTLPQKREILRTVAEITILPMGHRRRNEALDGGIDVRWKVGQP